MNPARVTLTVPMSARLRRERLEWIMIHRADLTPQEISQHEGMPVTTVERAIMDVLSTTHRTDIARKAITDALRAGQLNVPQESRLRRLITRSALEPSLSTKRSVQRGVLIRKESR